MADDGATTSATKTDGSNGTDVVDNADRDVTDRDGPRGDSSDTDAAGVNTTNVDAAANHTDGQDAPK